MQWIEKIAEDYAERFTTKLDDSLQKIYDDTLANHEHAHMMSSDVQGKFLEFISKLLQPKYAWQKGCNKTANCIQLNCAKTMLTLRGKIFLWQACIQKYIYMQEMRGKLLKL